MCKKKVQLVWNAKTPRFAEFIFCLKTPESVTQNTNSICRSYGIMVMSKVIGKKRHGSYLSDVSPE